MRHMWRLFPEGVDANFIKIIEEVASKRDTIEGSVVKQDLNKPLTRVSDITWLSGDGSLEVQQIQNIIYKFVATANRMSFNFNIENHAEIQYTMYSADKKGHFDWHEDVQWGKEDFSDRKLSVTIQLSDPAEYEGGNFEFEFAPPIDPTLAKKKGTVVVFPSYLRHRVTPVTQGVRKSLVAWFEGPRWK